MSHGRAFTRLEQAYPQGVFSDQSSCKRDSTLCPVTGFCLVQGLLPGLGLEWSDENMALFNLGGSRFYLQRYYVKEWAENSMLHVSVPDAAYCFDAITGLMASGRFPSARVAAPKHEPYGAWVTYVWDPSGVLLHLAQWDK